MTQPAVIEESTALELRYHEDPGMSMVKEVLVGLMTRKITAIKSQEQADEVTAMLNQIVAAKKALEARRKELGAPLRLELDAINTLAKRWETQLEEGHTKLKPVLGKWMTAQEEQAQKKQEAADKERERMQQRFDKKNIDVVVPQIQAAPAPTKIRTGAGTAYRKVKQTVEVTNLGELVKAAADGTVPWNCFDIKQKHLAIPYLTRAVAAGDLPAEVLTPLPKKLTKLVGEGMLKIPGCEVGQDFDIATRGV